MSAIGRGTNPRKQIVLQSLLDMPVRCVRPFIDIQGQPFPCYRFKAVGQAFGLHDLACLALFAGVDVLRQQLPRFIALDAGIG